MRIFQKGFNFGQDGPGNRLVYHMQGCNMRCIWCSNPEGMSSHGGKEVSPEEILDECIRSRMMFFSGGGVTFTGGEATLWHNELLQTLRLLHEHGIHTAIETNGTDKELSALLEYVDYLIMDFKHYDTEALKKYTGVGNETVKRNFEQICQSARQLHIRIPLINGINTEDPEGFAEYFSKFNTSNTAFEFLAYHEYGKGKWKEEYKVVDGFISAETLDDFKQCFSKHGLRLIIT